MAALITFYLSFGAGIWASVTLHDAIEGKYSRFRRSTVFFGCIITLAMYAFAWPLIVSANLFDIRRMNKDPAYLKRELEKFKAQLGRMNEKR